MKNRVQVHCVEIVECITGRANSSRVVLAQAPRQGEVLVVKFAIRGCSVKESSPGGCGSAN